MGSQSGWVVDWLKPRKGLVNCVLQASLGLVHREGAAPRLIGDSSVSNANALCRIEERVELPGLRDVAAFLSRYPEQSWSAFSLDISKAHKRVKVHPSERGLSLFSLRDPCGKQRWVVYHTCTFGCSWAAYWWSRVGAVFVRLGHQLLFHMHFLCMYVDDSLALFTPQTGRAHGLLAGVPGLLPWFSAILAQA